MYMRICLLQMIYTIYIDIYDNRPLVPDQQYGAHTYADPKKNYKLNFEQKTKNMM